MWIPDPIYKALPIVYAIVGVSLVPLFGLSTPIVVSAAMFLAAAAITVYWRFQFRERPPPIDQVLRKKWAERRARRIAALEAMDLK